MITIGGSPLPPPSFTVPSLPLPASFTKVHHYTYQSSDQNDSGDDKYHDQGDSCDHWYYDQGGNGDNVDDFDLYMLMTSMHIFYKGSSSSQ